jgi:hypothetical protein
MVQHGSGLHPCHGSLPAQVAARSPAISSADRANVCSAIAALFGPPVPPAPPRRAVAIGRRRHPNLVVAGGIHQAAKPPPPPLLSTLQLLLDELLVLDPGGLHLAHNSSLVRRPAR